MTRTLLIAAVGGALAVLSGCGDDDEGAPIPAANAQELDRLLDQVNDRIEARNACGDIREESLPALQTQLDQLPSDLDSNTRQTLEDGVAHLEDLVDEQCGEIQRDKERDRTESDTTETTTTVPTDTTTDTQTDTTTTDTQTDTDTQTEPPTEPPTVPQGGGISPGEDDDE